MAEVFGCCSSYMECSRVCECLHTGDPEYSGCQYKKNLDKGNVFYGAGNQKKPFTITMKSSNWWTYKVPADIEKKILDLLESVSILKVPEWPGRCTSRVVLDMEDAKYVIYGPDTRTIPERAADEIAKKLKARATTSVEVMSEDIHPEAMPEVMTKVMTKTPAKAKTVKEVPASMPVQKPKFKQTTIFDLMGG